MSHKARLFQKKDQIREEVLHIRLKESLFCSTNHERIDRPILKVTPRIDQRINGVPKCQVEQDPTRREFIANLARQVLQSSNRKAGGIIVPQHGQKTRPMSEETKSIIVEQ